MKFEPAKMIAHVAQERLLPEPAEPLGDLRAQARRVALALLLERRADREQRREREDVGDRVDEERHGATEPEERAAERRRDERHRRVARLLRGRRIRELDARHDGAERADLGDVEEDERRPFDERDDRDLRERQVVDRERDDEARRSRRSGSTSATIISHFRFQRSAATPAKSPKSAYGHDAREADDAGLRRRVRHREDEQRIGDRGRLRTRRREESARPAGGRSRGCDGAVP